MQNGTCHIVGAGDFDPSLLHREERDLLIAADAGYALLSQYRILPDLYLGDGDSLGFVPNDVPAVVLPKVKDDTDTVAAAKEGLARSYRRFAIYGALGGSRFSHSLANLQVLSFLADHGAEGVIYDKACSIRLLLTGKHTFSFEGGFFSLFCEGDSAELSVLGARYPLQHAVMTSRFPLGVSNEGVGKTCIQIHRGRVFLVREA